MHPFLLHNGEIRKTQDHLLSPGQVGYLNGWGVFSTFRVRDGVLFAFSRHYARMKRDAELMRVPFEIDAAQLEQSLLKLVEANQSWNATLRVAVVRNRGGLFEAAGLTRDFDVLAFSADLRTWGDGVTLFYVPEGRHAGSVFAGTKVTSWAQNLVWYDTAHERGYDEVLFLNQRGEVSECTSANLFAVFGSEVVTPPLKSSGCLPGVTRAVLLEEVKVPSLSIVEQDLSPEQLETADQIFITSSTRDLLPVLAIEGRPVRQAPEVFQRLKNGFLTYQQQYTMQHQPMSAAAKS